jgi:hypothetical protein
MEELASFELAEVTVIELAVLVEPASAMKNGVAPRGAGWGEGTNISKSDSESLVSGH